MKTWKFANGFCARGAHGVAWARTKEGAIAKAKRMTGKKPSKSTKKSQKGAVIFVNPKAVKPKSKKKGGYVAKKKKRSGGKKYMVPGLITGSGKVKISGAVIYGTLAAATVFDQGELVGGAAVSPLESLKAKDYSGALRGAGQNLKALAPYLIGGLVLGIFGGPFNQRLTNSPLIL